MGLVKKISFFLVTLLILLGSRQFVMAQEETPIPTTQASESVNSYELFWPVVAGRVMGEPLYPLKMLKEKVRQMFILGDYRKVDYNIFLSVKRTVEAEKLFIEKKDYKNAKKTLDAAQVKREKARDIIMSLKAEDASVNNLIDNLSTSIDKQRLVLSQLASRVPEEQKGIIEENIKNLDSLKDSFK